MDIYYLKHFKTLTRRGNWKDKYRAVGLIWDIRLQYLNRDFELSQSYFLRNSITPISFYHTWTNVKLPMYALHVYDINVPSQLSCLYLKSQIMSFNFERIAEYFYISKFFIP